MARKKRVSKPKSVLTTSDVAKVCQVSPRIVTQWHDKGLLEGYLLPGSKHRRFTKANVIAFMERQKMPQEMIDKIRVSFPDPDLVAVGV